MKPGDQAFWNDDATVVRVTIMEVEDDAGPFDNDLVWVRPPDDIMQWANVQDVFATELEAQAAALSSLAPTLRKCSPFLDTQRANKLMNKAADVIEQLLKYDHAA